MLIQNGLSKLINLIGFKINIRHDHSCDNEPCPYFQQCKHTRKHIRVTQVYTNYVLISNITYIMYLLSSISPKCIFFFEQNKHLFTVFANRQFTDAFS